MKRVIAGLLAGLVLGTAGVAGAQEGNPFEELQAAVAELMDNDEEQDARLAALEARDRVLRDRLRRETNLRIRFDRQLASCGMLGFRDWTFRGRLVFGPVDTEQVFHCFRDARQNARYARP